MKTVLKIFHIFLHNKFFINWRTTTFLIEPLCMEINMPRLYESEYTKFRFGVTLNGIETRRYENLRVSERTWFVIYLFHYERGTCTYICFVGILDSYFNILLIYVFDKLLIQGKKFYFCFWAEYKRLFAILQWRRRFSMSLFSSLI